MSKRTERRAAEREARKAAYQELRQQAAQPVESDAHVVAQQPSDTVDQTAETAESRREKMIEEPMACAATLGFFGKSASIAPGSVSFSPVSEAQLAANRANAQLSSGPATPEGKAKSSQNALKHGLTGATVLLPTDDAAEYERRLEACRRAYNPVGEEEEQLVQSMFHSLWRISRAQTLQMGIMYKGNLEFAKQFADQEPARRRMLIEVETYLKYEKSLRNLQVQEARLYRRYEKDVAELKRIQQVRKSEEREAAKAARLKPNHKNGFEFSTPKSQPDYAPQSGSQPTTDKVSAASNPLS